MENTLNLTITESGMVRSLAMFRRELEAQGAKAGRRSAWARIVPLTCWARPVRLLAATP
jgi:hypothetical protein